MRVALLACVVALGIVPSASAQSLRVEVSHGEFRSAMTPEPMPYATLGRPWVAVPAVTLKGPPPSAASFRIRAWLEGDGVRVIVFAVPRTKTPEGQVPGTQEREQQIASVFVAVGKPVEIAATEKFNARRIRLTVTDSSLVVMRYRIERYFDTPIPEPWQPPPRGSR